MDMLGKYDTALLGILQHEGQIMKFLDVVIGFLYRRTDFFIEMENKTDKLGFPPGVSLNLLIAAFKKYEKLAFATKTDKQIRNTENAPPVSKIIEVETTEMASDSGQSSTGIANHAANNTAHLKSQVNGTVDATTLHPSVTKSTTDNSQQMTESKESSAAGSGPLAYQSDAECYNGAVRENYSWAQTISDIDLRVTVPEYVKKGKDVRVIVERKGLIVQYKDSAGKWQVVIDDGLPWFIMKEEAVWSLVPGEHIHISLEKVQERWWEKALVGDTETINVRKIDCSRPMGDLDDEAQVKIEEMMYNQQQKRLGLPQSHETKVQDVLRKAWDADGSPFKGQPYDPSLVKIENNGAS